MWRTATILLMMLTAAVCAVAQAADPGRPAAPCATVVDMGISTGKSTRYGWVPGQSAKDSAEPIAAILLAGGGGWLDMDDAGCPRRLNGNILVRTAPLLQAGGIATVLLDARSDWTGDDGLAGFRIQNEHADDLGRVIADVRLRTGAKTVWLIGHSRGTLSAANAAARLTGVNAPDGIVLASAMLAGEAGRRKPWAAQTVFDTPLRNFKGALLVVGHDADNCVRSLPQGMDELLERTGAIRKQVVRVTGGPRSVGRAPSLATCEVREAHDFVGQDAEFAASVLRFMYGGAL